MLLSWQNIAEFVGSFAALTSVVGLVLWMWLKPKIDREFATKEALDNEVARSKARETAIEERMHESLVVFERRLSTMEADLRTLPTKEDHHRLALQISKQAGTLEALSASINQVSEGIKRIEDVLFNLKT